MEPNSFEIYKGKKYVGILPGKYIKKTDFCEEHLMLSDTYDIRPGYTIIADNREKLYVTDVRLYRSHSSVYKLEVFYEIEGKHQRRISAERKTTFALVISLISLIVSIIALIKNIIS